MTSTNTEMRMQKRVRETSPDSTQIQYTIAASAVMRPSCRQLIGPILELTHF